jgi:glycosyltransferase involved in cell wall biosynthesis
MKIAIYEPTIHGHRAAYLSEITAAAARRGWDVTVITPFPDHDHPYFSMLHDLIGRQNVLFTPYFVEWPKRLSPLSIARFQFQQWHAARRSLLSVGREWDFVYFPNLDYMDDAIAILGTPSRPVPMGGMVMRIRYHLKQLGVETSRSLGTQIEMLSFSRLLKARGVALVTTADPSFAKYCAQQSAAGYRKVHYVPELGMRAPPLDAASAKRAFGFRPDDKVVLIYGAIDARKAFAELIAAVSGPMLSDRIRVLIVGRPDEPSATVLNGAGYEALRRQGVLVNMLEFADRNLQEKCFAAADAVWVAYRNHSTMSGVFSQAMSCSLPVIGPNYGLLSWLISEYSVGICVDIDKPTQTGLQILKMLCNEEIMQGFRNKASRMSREHLPENFGNTICDAITSGLEWSVAGEKSARQPLA